jgi:hypothetical protein
MQHITKKPIRRRRSIAVLAVGIALGTTMAASPAGAHVGGTVSHLWNHLKPLADARYANAVSGTDKAKDADKLDGLDSAAFVKGSGNVVGDSVWVNMTSGVYEGSVLSIPGVGDVRYRCEFAANLQFSFKNESPWFQTALEDQGGQADPTRRDLDLNQATPLTAAKTEDLVTYLVVNQGSNEWTTKITVGGIRAGNNICYVWGQAVVSPPS